MLVGQYAITSALGAETSAGLMQCSQPTQALERIIAPQRPHLVASRLRAADLVAAERASHTPGIQQIKLRYGSERVLPFDFPVSRIRETP